MCKLEGHLLHAHHVYIFISAADFTPNDAFVGYQQDTPASIVLKVWQDLKLDDGELSDQDKDKVANILVQQLS